MKFLFLFLVFCALSKTSFAKSAIKNICLCFHLSFVVLALICRSFIHFEVIFKYGVKCGLGGFLFMLSCHHLSHHPASLGSFVKHHLIIMWRFILGLSILFHWSIFLSLCQYHCLDYHHFVISFEMGKCDFSNSVLFQELNSILILELADFYIEVGCDSVRYCIESIDQFGFIDIIKCADP